MTFAKAAAGVRHAMRSQALKRSKFPAMLAEFPHLAVVRIRCAPAVDDFLSGLLLSAQDIP